MGGLRSGVGHRVRCNGRECVTGQITHFEIYGGDPEKLAAFGQPRRLRQSLRPRLHCLNGEALATLAATPRENRLPVFGPHADEETVRALATAVVWLIRALHVR